MSGGQWMVVLIVAMVVIGKIVSRGLTYDTRRQQRLSRVNNGEEDRLREEVRALKERLSVLERIATDPSRSLEAEIEALRDRRGPDRSRIGTADDTNERE